MPSHVDASIIYVPIMPETSGMDSAMEKVGKDATESFGKGSSGIGDKIHDSISKSKDKLKDVFHRSGSDASEAMAEGVKQGSSKVEDAIDDVGTKATHKFNDATKGFGKVLVNAIGPDTQKLLGDKLEETVGGALEGVLGDNSKLAGKFAHTVADWGFEELKNKLGDVQGAAEKTKKAFASFKDGDTIGGVSKLVEGFDKLGIEVKDLPKPLQDVVGQISDGKNTALEFAGVFKDLPGKIGLVGTAIEGLAGPLGIVLGLSAELFREAQASEQAMANAFHDPAMRAAMEKREGEQHPFIPSTSDKPLPPMDITTKTAEAQLAGSGDKEALADLQLRAQRGDKEAENLLRDNNLQTAIKPDPIASAPMPTGGWFGGKGRGHGPIAAAPHSSAPPSVPASGSSFGSDNFPSSFIGGASSSFSSPSDLHAGGSRIANLYAVAQSLQGTPYSQALRNDCSGMVSKLATAALGMSPSVQFSTPNEGDWLFSHGFQPGEGPAGSFRVGWNPLAGNAGHTAATLPDGTNAESGGSHGNFLLGPGAAGADDKQFTNHAWLPMDGSIPGSGGRNRPVGDEHDPLYVTQTAGANGSGGSDMQNQGQQLGSGLLDGLAQSVGLDGSVFKGFGGASNPAHFGITKLATGLLNWGAGQVQGGDGASLGGGSGGGGIPGLGMLSGLMSHGAAASANTVPIGPGGAQNVRTGETTTHNYNDNSFTVNQSGVQGSGVQDWRHANNSAQNRTGAMTVNNGGNLPGQ